MARQHDQQHNQPSKGRSSTAEIVQIMGRRPVFAVLSANERCGLAQAGVGCAYAAGEDLIRQRQEFVGIGLDLLLSGRVQATQRADDGHVHDLVN
jgi:hypothetical protein